MAQLVIFTDLVEQRRWDGYTGGSLPSPWAWPVGSYLRHKSYPASSYDWYTRNSAAYGWTYISPGDVPKALQLLTLLE